MHGPGYSLPLFSSVLTYGCLCSSLDSPVTPVDDPLFDPLFPGWGLVLPSLHQTWLSHTTLSSHTPLCLGDYGPGLATRGPTALLDMNSVWSQAASTLSCSDHEPDHLARGHRQRYLISALTCSQRERRPMSSRRSNSKVSPSIGLKGLAMRCTVVE